MPITRRNFLGTLAAAIGLAAVPGVAYAAQQKKLSKADPTNVSARYSENLLIDSFFPTLAKNEGECLHFYRCTSKKVSVGYGTNVQDNSAALTGVSVYHKGKALTPDQLKTFLATMTSMTKRQLKRYTITKADAKKMALSDMRATVDYLSRHMTDDKKKSVFFTFPLCMQALCLDIAYNIGVDKFLKTYPKLQAALKQKNYALAVRESTVYVNKKTKAVNVSRENRKKRLLRIMNLVRNNIHRSVQDLCALITTDYQTQVSLRNRLWGRTAEIENEHRMAMGEMAYLRFQNQRAAQAGRPTPKPAQKSVVKETSKTAAKPIKQPILHKSVARSTPASKVPARPIRGPEM